VAPRRRADRKGARFRRLVAKGQAISDLLAQNKTGVDNLVVEAGARWKPAEPAASLAATRKGVRGDRSLRRLPHGLRAKYFKEPLYNFVGYYIFPLRLGLGRIARSGRKR
jgi:hypothetical protein